MTAVEVDGRDVGHGLVDVSPAVRYQARPSAVMLGVYVVEDTTRRALVRRGGSRRPRYFACLAGAEIAARRLNRTIR